MQGVGALDGIIRRLEGVAARLEAAEGGVTSRASSSGGPQLLSDWDASIAPALTALSSATETLDDDVRKCTQIVVEAFAAERGVVEATTTCQKPDQAGLQALLAPVAAQIDAADMLTGSRRGAAFNHFKAVADVLPALAWVAYTGSSCGMSAPAKHVEESWQAAEFFANKILVEHRGTPHAAWVRALKDALMALRGFVAKHAAAGPAWNARGVPVAQFRPGASGAASAPAAGAASAPAAGRGAGSRGPPPPPPPPPPPGSLLMERPANRMPAAPAGPNMNALFAELNKGEAVTGGLRKVTDDMKTKNRADRPGVVPPSAEGRRTVMGAAAKARASAPARMALEADRKWVVEHHVDNHDILLGDTNSRQTVYIFGCRNSTIQVKGKVNAITIDQCVRTGVVFEDLVAVCELVNSQALQVQVTGRVPTIAVDKCDGVQLFLSAASLDATVTTAKSSEVNVAVPGATPDADLVEHPLPEQFSSTYKDGRFITVPVSHSGG
ncbi:hypothetical protein WJX81_002108 [Elliptochloris bilobata]|uniref:C-CAP/cofactor C-like domain-containing protein n=1 Tax=Elliptochloris bilobata TaxID=381761 RepID=A0AAW1QL76_9CHLO